MEKEETNNLIKLKRIIRVKGVTQIEKFDGLLNYGIFWLISCVIGTKQ